MKTIDPAVRDYLRRLDRAGASLPASERAELRESVIEHVAAAEANGESADAALARLGSPEAMAAAALPEGVAPGEKRMRPVDVGALVLLQLGGLAFGVGWLVGVVLLWVSDRWKWWEKLLGTLVVPGGLAFLLVFVWPTVLLAVSQTGCLEDSPCGTQPTSAWMPLAMVSLAMLACVVVTVYLARVARPGRSRRA